MTDESADTDDRSLGDIAGSLESTLKADLGETLVGLASYEDGEYDVLYRDEAASSQYAASDIRAILEHIQLEAIGTAVYEEYHGESLHAAVRVYDTLVTITVPVEETTGLVVVVRNDSSSTPATRAWPCCPPRTSESTRCRRRSGGVGVGAGRRQRPRRVLELARGGLRRTVRLRHGLGRRRDVRGGHRTDSWRRPLCGRDLLRGTRRVHQGAHRAERRRGPGVENHGDPGLVLYNRDSGAAGKPVGAHPYENFAEAIEKVMEA